MKFGEDWGKDLVKTDKWYIGPVKDWETKKYKYKLHAGVSDFIYNNCRKIIETGDKSAWAYALFKLCANLLIWEQRWPVEILYEIPKDRICKNRLCSVIQKHKSRLRKKANIRRVAKGKDKKAYNIKFRSWNDQTRDNYIAFFACAVFLEEYDAIKEVSIPWSL